MASFQSVATTVSSVDEWNGHVLILIVAYKKAGLFAAVEAQLLLYVKSQLSGADVGQPPSTKRALLIFSYGGLLFSCGAAISSFLLTIKFSEWSIRAAHRRSSGKGELKGHPSWSGVFNTWPHCESTTLATRRSSPFL